MTAAKTPRSRPALPSGAKRKPDTVADRRTGARTNARTTATAPAVPYHHGDLHAALLAAAEAIVEADGPDGLTLRAAARAAGVSHAAPKNHFGDLTGLLSELAAVGFHRFAQELADAGRRPQPVASPEASFDAIGSAYVGFAHAHRGLFLLMFRSDRLDANRPALRGALDEAAAVLAAGVANRIGSEPATAHAPSPAQGAAMLRAWSLVHGFSMLLIDGRLDPILARMPPGTDWQTLLASALSAPPAR